LLVPFGVVTVTDHWCVASVTGVPFGKAGRNVICVAVTENLVSSTL